jgi:hypothetical protein
MYSDQIRIPKGLVGSNNGSAAFLCFPAHQDEFQVDLNRENKFKTKNIKNKDKNELGWPKFLAIVG